MGKQRTGPASLTANAKYHDPTIDALFSSSIGPVTRNPPSRYAIQPRSKPAAKPPPKDEDDDEDDSDDDEIEEDDSDDDEIEEGDDMAEDAEVSEHETDQEASDEAGSDEYASALEELDEEASSEEEEEEEEEPVVVAKMQKKKEANQEDEEDPKAKTTRKRKRRDEEDDLEARYLNKLAREEEAEHAAKKKRTEDGKPVVAGKADAVEDSNDDDDDAVPIHESIESGSKSKPNEAELEKASRTVFLSNVSSSAVSSKSAKKTLLAHLCTALEPGEKVESIRFRSVAFSSVVLPKRAAFITGSVMDSTTRSANAYAVYSTAAAARRAASKLNGTVVLDRHLRVDSVAHPGATNHRRCVFVGNLTFIDDETIVKTKADGERVEEKRTKKPADVEEGLWRAFGSEGRRVENVRVVRDPKTRVGKGFAYVQFYDENDVESALLLEGKKFPPMLPRTLRVTRAKALHKTALAMERSKSKLAAPDKPANGPAKKKGNSGRYVPKVTPEQQSQTGRAGRLLGRSAASQQQQQHARARTHAGFKSAEDVVVEGRRASAKDGPPAGLRLGGKQRPKGAGRKAAMKSRGSKRASAWRGKEKGGK